MSKWIKCSDKLPEKDGDYLATTIYGQVHEVSYAEGWNCCRLTTGAVNKSFESPAGFIVAWQEMPAAYVEG